MTEEERRFKVEQINKYNKDIKKENINKNIATFLLGFTTLTLLYATPQLSELGESLKDLIYRTAFVTQTFMDAYLLKELMESISRKTKLEGKVDELVDELKLDEIKRGR